jgi:hypothetical protein
VESLHQRCSRGDREVLASGKAVRDVLGRGVEPAQDASHPAAIVERLVRAVPARLAFDERRHRDGVPVAEAANEASLDVSERSDDEVEPGLVPERARRAVRPVERREGRVGVRAGLKASLEVVGGNESPIATSVVGSPVVAAESDRQVLERYPM